MLLDGRDHGCDAAKLGDGVLHGVVVHRDVYHGGAGVLRNLVVPAVGPQGGHDSLDTALVLVEGLKTSGYK